MLYGKTLPQPGAHRTVRYDDGSGNELEVLPGTTAFVSGNLTMSDLLPLEPKSVAVHGHAKYSLHPCVWMALAAALPTRLGLLKGAVYEKALLGPDDTAGRKRNDFHCIAQ
ncbi:hypothetical protein C8Q80DRAFT_1273102 [Daedaleopsis nitida]|nr:hypothetical protein C8Q80DRAFT_1273102 [Daedaleopsis nitida]